MWQNLIDKIASINDVVNGYVWGWPMIVLILGTGLLLTLRSRVMQLRKFKDSINATIVPVIKGFGKGNKNKNKSENSVSQFEAFSAAISGTVGTGNIVGVTSAILTGGPGAVVWMWISAFFGMITNYSENVLGLYYRVKDGKGGFSGGSFYYIANGIKQKWLGYLAAIFCLIAAVGMSGVQTNKIAETLYFATGSESVNTKLIIGVIVAVLSFAVIIGGIKRIGKITSMLVPFMSLLFIIMALVIIVMNYKAVPATFALIFGNMFSMKAVAGGAGGFVFSQIIKKGLARGVFSNEAGLGSSVIAHSASETREPVKQGLWGIFEVFFDTFVICTLTALVVLTTNISSGALYTADFWSSNDSAVALQVFSSQFGIFGTVGFSIILPLFAFTTIIAWSYYGEKAAEFCFGWLGEKGTQVAIVIFKIIYISIIVASAVIEGSLVWALDDTFNGLMALPNLIALICLSGQISKITKNYYDRKKGVDVKPMLSAYPEQNEEFIQYIKDNQQD